MKRIYFFGWLSLFYLLTVAAYAQNVRGHVTDLETGESLPGVTIAVANTTTGTTTDAKGNYSLSLTNGTHQIQFSFVGYNNQIREVSINNNDITLNIVLAPGTQTLTDVVIVGSRSTQIRSNVETVAPIDVISVRELQTTGQIEPGQMMNMVAPSFNSSRQTLADGTDHIDPATLRGLGPDQVLVLLNGKRRHNQALLNLNGTVGRGSVGTDLNTIPVAGIERIEVLREGAASQYGSDAIAGVINVVMKKDTGTTANLHLGQFYEGDGSNAQVGVYHGIKAGNLGVIGIAADVRLREATNRAGRYTGPVYQNWNVSQLPNESQEGWLNRRQTLYNQDQALINQNNFNLENNLLVGNSAVDNFNGMLNGRLKVAPKTEVYFTGILNYRKGMGAGFYRYPYQTNQLIPEIFPNGFLPEIHSTIWDRSGLVGISGEWGKGWRWDLSNVIGGNYFRFDVENSVNASQYELGANAPTTFYAGTLKFNQNTSDFGVSKDFGQAIGLQSFNVAAGLSYRLDNYQILAGEEASYRNFNPASGRAGGAQVFPGYQPANAVNENRNVFAGYLDIETDITDKLLLNAAGRYEDYSDFGGNLAGKLSARYKFAEFFSLRGTLSNGFRAPSIHQRYFSAISTVFISVPNQGLQPRQQGTFRNDGPVAAAFGIPSLKAEKSTNYSLGITSQLLPNMTLTIDAYRIDIKDRIVLTGQFQRGTSAAGQQTAALLDAAGQTDVQAAIFFTNAVNTRTEGLDVVLSGDYPLGQGTINLTLAGNLNKTEVQGEPKVSETLPTEVFGNVLFNRQERGRLEWAQPRSKFTLGGTYRLNNFSSNLRVTRFGEVKALDPNTPQLDEDFSPKTITDLSVSYRFTKWLQFTIGGNNIFDVYPDKLAVTQYPTATNPTSLDNSSFDRFVYGRAATQFGFNGGYYYGSLAFNF
ncbi:TonB-dependent receptor [Adhaeribacter radiodurans]|uniref:TonB-dependent receptor n=1 Tax=Adhaeribacter radiodurans TaxID=2745197 RepID=A0A7L7LEI7_9BACT|nr:TonB-dependent receptor [Adhaeribacter radiodurans]QMU31258.1 TonB-dependent receptor [Adhaeribacter radiodurans]